MTASYVTVTLDLTDGSGYPLTRGMASWTPSMQFPDPADQMLVSQAPVTAVFRAGSPATVRLIANDTAGPQQSGGTPGWSWQVTFAGVPGNPPPASYYVLAVNGATQRLSELATAPVAQPGSMAVTSVNGQSGAVTLDAAGVGAASSSALAAEVIRAEAAEALLAPLDSPSLTGDPTAPTPAPGDSSTKIATTAFVAALHSASPPVPGQYLCAPSQYAPAGQTALTTTSATMSAVSSANVNTGSFTAPPSGNVLVTVTLIMQVSSSGDAVGFGLAAHGTVVPMVGYVPAWKEPVTTQPFVRTLQFLVTGLTPGASCNFDLMFAVASGGTLTVYANNQTGTSPNLSNAGVGGPVVMTVQAA